MDNALDLSQYNTSKVQWGDETRYVLNFHGQNESYVVINGQYRLALGSYLCLDTMWGLLSMTEIDAWKHLPEAVKQANYV